MKYFFNKIWYYIKQLFPCLYVSTYSIDETEMISIWRQWLGKIIWAEVYELNSETTIVNSKIPPLSTSPDFEATEEYFEFISAKKATELIEESKKEDVNATT